MTESGSSSLRARQEPTAWVSPPSDDNLAQACFEIACTDDEGPLPWQRFVLKTILGIEQDGTWAASTAGLLLPRQNGKSEGVIKYRVALGLLYLNERIIFTSHRQDAATEFYEALKRFLDSDEYRDYVAPDGFKGALGRERINMRSGAFIQFVARSNKGGRAKHSDLLILDEAQFLDHSELASLTPTQETSPNPQIIYAGTPPDKLGFGYDFAGVRSRALSGKSNGIAWCEWAVPDLPKDVSDRRLWYETNPSLGTLISEKNIELQLNNLDAVDFAREVLCWWPPEVSVGDLAIQPSDWDACETAKAPESAPDERVACGIKFSGDGATYSISMAARSKRESYTLLECVDRAGTGRGVSGLADWLYERRDTIATVSIDGRSWTPTLVQRLEDVGFPKRAVHVMRVGELCDACAMLRSATEEQSVVHIQQPLLEESVKTSSRRDIGRDGWAFAGPDPTPIESCALAYWGVMTTKRNPKQKLRVSV